VRIVINGAGGNLGRLCLARLREQPGQEVIGLARAELDLEQDASIAAALTEIGSFDLLINCAAWTDVDGCEADPAKADQINGHAVGLLGEACARGGARMIHVSTDYVFDGTQVEPYREEDPTGPISIYGASKRLGEESLLAASAEHLVVRVSWLFGSAAGGFPLWVVRQAMKTDGLSVVADKWGTPTSVADAVDALAFLALRAPEARGILHVCNAGETSWRDWGQCALDAADRAGLPLKTRELGATTMKELAAKAGWKAQRPVHSALSCHRFAELRGQAPRPWEAAVEDYVLRELAPLLHEGQL
jgi:dTDP-4-dehydrorhamnose reductase